jgi:hypothetical protein
VYPTADIDLDPSLPANAEFWVPEPDEIDDYEGFGMFQDVWPITEVSVDEANAVAREDGLLCHVVGRPGCSPQRVAGGTPIRMRGR